MEKRGVKTRNIAILIIAVLGGMYTVSRFGASIFGLMSGVNVAVIIGLAGMVIGRKMDDRSDKGQGYVVEDEMTKMVQWKASKTAFIWGNYVWLAIIWYDFIGDSFTSWPLLNTQQALLLGLLVNLGIYIVSYTLNGKKV